MITKNPVHDYPKNYAESRIREMAIKVNEIITTVNRLDKKIAKLEKRK